MTFETGKQQSIPRTSWVWREGSVLMSVYMGLGFTALFGLSNILAGGFIWQLFLLPGFMFLNAIYMALAIIRRVHTFSYAFMSDHLYVHEENPNVKRERKIWYWQMTKISIRKMDLLGEPLFDVVIEDKMPNEYPDPLGRLNWPGSNTFGILSRRTLIAGLTSSEAESLKAELERRIQSVPPPRVDKNRFS